MTEMRIKITAATKLFSPGVLIGGALAGIIGGILMGVAVTLFMRNVGLGSSTPWQAIAGTFYGPMAFVGAQGVTAIGVLLFLSVAAAFGIAFAALTLKARSALSLFFIGIPYGVAVWALMTYVFVTVFDPTLGARIPMIAVMWFFLHWIYGAFTGMFTPWFRRAFGLGLTTVAPAEPPYLQERAAS